MATRRCPACNSPMGREKTEFHPFCTKRCRLIDLGRWLGEDYRVAEKGMHELLGGELVGEGLHSDPQASERSDAPSTAGEAGEWFSFETPYPVADDDDGSGHTIH